MNDISQLQVKRAVNIIWNCAEDHSFTPDFKVYDSQGNADLYRNCIVGAVRRHYEYPKLETLLRSFEQYEDADMYQGLFWLGLENCVFEREKTDRPVLSALRKKYAEAFTAQFPDGDGYHLFEKLASAHYRRVLGQEVKLDAYNSKLLDELEFSGDMSTDEIVRRTSKLFEQWFQICTEEKKREKRQWLLGLRRRKAAKTPSRFRKFGIGFAEHPENIYGGASTQDIQDRQLRTKMSGNELRSFMETKYGKPIFSPAETARMERSLCVGSHEDCHLLITNGERIKASQIQNGFEALERQRESEQIVRNRRAYNDNRIRNSLQILRLSEKIQNSVLLYMQAAAVKSNSGKLCAGRAWRAARLDDEKVFERSEQTDMGDLTVDILLDASTSQKYRQETVSAQGYIIAESLTKCGIPCRVMSFCSMTGYTVLRVFRDYAKPCDNSKIFEYVSNGCNRDGLAIAAANYLMSKTSAGHRLLIILSDVKPNDVIKIKERSSLEKVQYYGQAGVTNTAFEVRRARAEGVSVICVFTGNDEDVASARLVYGKDFARIQDLGKLADTVGKLIQSRIKNL